MAPPSALPIGAARVLSEMQPVLIDPSQPGSGLLNAVLALLASSEAQEQGHYDEQILDLPVSGFLVVCVFSLSLIADQLFMNPGPVLQDGFGYQESQDDSARAQSRFFLRPYSHPGLL